MAQQERMGTVTMKETLYVCVHVPEFPAQAMLRLRPEIAKQPTVVMEGDAPLEQVCSINQLAARLGLTEGMTRAELDAFPKLNVLRRSLAEEHQARTVLLETASAFSPRIELQPVRSNAFAMILDMTGTSRIFGQAQQSIPQIARAMKALNLFAQLAASANLHVALCIAPAARRTPLIISAGHETEHMAPMPLAALNLSAHQAEVLELWGLKTVGELAALPEVDLVVRLGQDGKRLRLLALGQHPHLMVPQETAFTLEEFLEFEAPVEILESLLFVASTMIEQLISRAQNRALALGSLTITLDLDGGGEYRRTIKPALPVTQRDLLLKLLLLDLQAHPPPAAALSLRVTAEPGDRSKIQLGLFAPQLPEAARLDVTLGRLAALVGEDRVGCAKLLDTHKPDSFAMQRFLATEAKEKPEASKNRSIVKRRCRPPIPISMHRDGSRPRTFLLHGRQYAVHEAYGPWRKSGQWWSAEVWSYEEWDIYGIATGGETLLCLVAHDLLRNSWHLEALYD